MRWQCAPEGAEQQPAGLLGDSRGYVRGAGASAFCWARKRGVAAWPASGKAAPAGVAVTAGEGPGRSRGGLSTVLDAIAVRGPAGGRPPKRPDLLLADKGYAHDCTRAALRRRAIRCDIPSGAIRSPAASLILTSALIWHT